MEIQINKDLRKFESKDIGMFSYKQALWIAIGAIVAGISLAIQKIFFGDWTLEITILPAIPIWFIGLWKIQGLSVIEYLKQIFPEQFLLPKSLKWESDFEYTETTAQELYGDDFEKIHFIKTEPDIKKKQPKKRKKK